MPRDGTAAGAALAAAPSDAGRRERGRGRSSSSRHPSLCHESAAFSAAARGTRHGALILATGPGPFLGAPGATVVASTPDTADAARIAALAQRHFAAAPSDDPAMRWRDMGPWVALLAVPAAALLLRRGLLAAAVALMLLAAPAAPAAEGDLVWFWQLWLTPDQRAQLLLDRGEAARAAPLFTDPVRRGVALYRAGDYEGRPRPSHPWTRRKRSTTAATR